MLISPKLAQVFVRCNLQLFNTHETLAPRSSIRFIFSPGATDVHNQVFYIFFSLNLQNPSGNLLTIGMSMQLLLYGESCL